MHLEIVSIGNEVLEGETLNRNAAFLSRRLIEQGYSISRHTVLPDDPESLSKGLQEALSRSMLTIATGGLGPTLDDVTKSCAARLFRMPLQIDSTLYDELRARFGDRPELESLATIPKEAMILRNGLGTAPGFLFLSEEGSLLLLPGPPREMELMFQQEALPLFKKHFPQLVPWKTLHLSLCLLREGDIDPLLREIQRESPDANIGIYPALGTLKLRFQVTHSFARLEEWAMRIRQAFETYVVEGPSLEEAVHRKLLLQQKKLALAESCTGGALAARLASLAGASEYLLGSLVVYANQWKEQFLGVHQHTLHAQGAVSSEVVREMAMGLLRQTTADYAIAISGIAGPTGGTTDKPVGTIFIAVGEREKAIDVGQIQAPPDRGGAIELAVQTALAALWRRLAYQTLTLSHESILSTDR